MATFVRSRKAPPVLTHTQKKINSNEQVFPTFFSREMRVFSSSSSFCLPCCSMIMPHSLFPIFGAAKRTQLTNHLSFYGPPKYLGRKRHEKKKIEACFFPIMWGEKSTASTLAFITKGLIPAASDGDDDEEADLTSFRIPPSLAGNRRCHLPFFFAKFCSQTVIAVLSLAFLSQKFGLSLPAPNGKPSKVATLVGTFSFLLLFLSVVARRN